MKITRRQLKNIIESYFPLEGISTQRLIYSPKPFSGFRDVQQDPFDVNRWVKKPKGLWYACGDEWAEFASGAGWKSRYNHLYEVELKHYEILFIKTPEDFERFEQMYGEKGNDRFAVLSINWPKVAQDYAGIEICPYRNDKRMSSDWYYGWDVASGCVWSSKGFAGVKEIPMNWFGHETPDYGY